MACTQATIALALLPFFTLPPLGLALDRCGRSVAHMDCKLFLVKAYAQTDLSQAYPLAQGTAPLGAALISSSALGTVLAPLEVSAIFAISVGIFLMALKGASGTPMSRTSLFFSLGTAVFIAGYTLVDGLGARIA